MNAAEFADACLRHQAALRSRAMRFTRSRADADDLVQHTLLRAIVKQDLFREGTDLRAWLLAILRNAFLGEWNSRAGRARLSERWEDDVRRATHVGTVEGPVRVAPQVVEAIAELPDIWRDVVVLVDVQGEAYADAASALGVPLGTMMSRLHRARRCLRVRLAEYAAEAHGITG